MTQTGSGMLAVWMQPRPDQEDDFNRWYDEEHLPERMAISGFLNARRYVSLQGPPKYMALYELESLDVLAGEDYARVRSNPTPWTRRIVSSVEHNERFEYELLLSMGERPAEPAPYVLMVRLETAPEHEQEFNAWYDQEHIAALCSVPGVYRARRYRARQGSPRYLALYEFAAPDIRTSEAWKRAAETPWTQKMRPLFTRRADHLGRLIKAV